MLIAGVIINMVRWVMAAQLPAHPRHTPAYTGINRAFAITAGDYHSAAIEIEAEEVVVVGYGWGANTSGQVGEGTTTNRNSEVEILFPAD
jgi:hypothetical protein